MKISEKEKREIASSEDKPGDNENSKRITRATTKAMKEKENKAGNKEQVQIRDKLKICTLTE